MHVSSIQEILTDFKAGRFVILVDDQNRENEGDLMIAAQFIGGEQLNFMLQAARGFICLCLSDEQVKRLELPLQFSELHSTKKNHAAFTYSIEASQGVTTGISARERALTIQTAIDPKAKPADICCPGHVLPLRAVPGGVLVRPGHTEASVDLAILAGLQPAGVLCEILDEQGEAADQSYLSRFAIHHGIKIGTVADLIAYRTEEWA